ncbi:MAG: tetratricopeptide repeat protein [Acidobacteriia bacterium]|nr:tetratricopeptide repeat protein [Terriglobia bacterium]
MRVLAAAALLAAASIVVYLPALDGSFVSDDRQNVERNDRLRTAGGLGETWVELRGPQGIYYPLTYTSYWIEHHLWGSEPRGYHAVNIVLHALNALLLWRVLRGLGIGGAWFASAAFALHPVQVESVAWITERRNVLSTLFLLAALWAYFRSRPVEGETPSRATGRIWYALTLVAFSAALLSKTVTLVLPPAVLLLVGWKRGRLTGRDMASVTPLFALGLAAGVVTWVAERGLVRGVGVAWLHRDLAERLALAGRLVGFYAGKVAWPAKLAFVYPRSEIDPHRWASWLPLLAVVAVLAALVAARRRIGRAPLAAALWFFLTLLPVLGLVDYFYLIYSDAADRFLYLPSLGPIVWVAAAATALASSRGARGRRLGLVLGLASLAALGACTLKRSAAFATPESLYADAVAKYPGSWGAQLSLGSILVGKGRSAEAIPHLEASRSLQPTVPGASAYLAVAYAQVGRVQDALAMFDDALRLYPGDLFARANLGLTLVRLGRDEEAAAALRRVLEADPTYTGTRQTLLTVLLRLVAARGSAGQAGEAVAFAREARDLAESPDLRVRLDAFIRNGGTVPP